MSASPSFPNMPTDSSLPEIGMYNPDPNTPSQDAGGKTKIQSSNTPPHATEQVGYGYMSPDLKNVGRADSNDGTLADNNNTGNTSGIPAAQPIDPITFGDVNNTNSDAPLDSFRRGFR